MAKKKRIEKKKKQRERDSKEKVLQRRETLRKRIKFTKMIDKDIKDNQEKLQPFISAEKQEIRRKEQIQKNLDLLKKLEDEYQKEQAAKAKLNSDLESQGYKTLADKVEALGKQAQALADEDGKIDLSIISGK